jgi:hypothetical protein
MQCPPEPGKSVARLAVLKSRLIRRADELGIF